jgi:outer membrane protein assembly factor BamB
VSSGGKIVIAGSKGSVAALNAADGSVRWRRDLPVGVHATPLVANDLVAVPTMGGELYSLALADGATAWRHDFGGQNYSSPVLVPRVSADERETFVLGAGFPQQSVWRFDVRTGEPVWTTAKGDVAAIVSSSPALVGDLAVIGMNGGRFQAFDLAAGATSWKMDASGTVYLSSPLVVGDRVYAFPGDAAASLFAVDARTAAPMAGFPVSIPDQAPLPGAQRLGRGPAVSSPVSVDGLVVVQLRRDEIIPSTIDPPNVSMREYVAAIDPATAQVRWQYSVATRIAENVNGVPELNACATPAAFSGPNGSFVAISSSIEGRVVVLEAQTGRARWVTTLSSPGRSSPVFSNGQLLVATDAGVIHAFASTSNRAPSAPTELGPSDEALFATEGTQLEWHGAADPDEGPLSYVVRIEQEGHPETRSESATSVGQSQIAAMLQPDTWYLFAVRSRDAQGALSAWSQTKRIHVSGGGPATIAVSADTPAPSMGPNPAAPPPSPPASHEPGHPPAMPCMPETSPPPPADAAPMTPLLPSVVTTGEATTAPLPASGTAFEGDDLADQGGCSLAGGSASAPASLALIGLIALATRSRARRSHGPLHCFVRAIFRRASCGACAGWRERRRP